MGKEDVGGADQVKIDVDALASKMNNFSPKRTTPCIFRVPTILSRHIPEAYTPKGFSIGPFHYNKPHLQATQKIKMRYMHELISSCFPHSDRKTKLKDLIVSVCGVQDEARECYEGSIDMNMEEFVNVLVLDGCFLIELFRRDNSAELRKSDDPIFGVNCMMASLYDDLVLLENQIPWLVLDCLFQKIVTTPEVVSKDELPLTTLVTNFFSGWWFSSEVDNNYEEIHKCENKHILDLLRNSLVLPSTKAKQKPRQRLYWKMMTATSLQEAGIKLKKAKSGITTTKISSILDIKFKDGILEIPQLSLHGVTETLFGNLICLEQCLFSGNEVITSYMVFLNHLIDSAKDVEILVNNDIMEKYMEMNDAIIFFNRITTHTIKCLIVTTSNIPGHLFQS
ncbi:hypothetical protein F8388_010319 [Cannabis sativa]|uniref:Uncharacterized protein n=1 Tax=Cannabis sativa TaxID=3483 RepID=A0A7J6HRE5_CANSA|nr:hypothetical protein F8388_010319 [Cannabis sativa]KAF4397451.1 hypothetical protein G4B88_027191 [Cannabis sativa]